MEAVSGRIRGGAVVSRVGDNMDTTIVSVLELVLRLCHGSNSCFLASLCSK